MAQQHLLKLKNIINKVSYESMLFLIVIIPGLIVWLHRFLVHFNIIHTTNWLEYFGDFPVLYGAAINLVSNGTVYGHGYSYPAASVLLLLPLAAFSYENALIFKILADIACYAITIHFVSKIIKSYTNIKLPKLHQFALFIAITISYPVSIAFAGGTVSAQVLVLTTVTYYYLFIRKKISTASILLFMATSFKIIPFALILLNRELRIKTSLLFISSLIISLYLLGIEQHILWIKHLFVTQSISTVLPTNFLELQTNIFNTSISLTIHRIIGYMNYPISFSSITITLIAIKVAIIVYIIWFVHKTYTYNTSNEKDTLYFSLLILTPLLLSNTAWIHYWPFLATPIILWIYTFELSKQDKTMIFMIMFLLSTQGLIGEIANITGGIIKTIIYIIPPITIASILMFVFIWNKIKVINTTTTKSD